MKTVFKRVGFWFALLLASGIRAEARIGETKEECFARYGKGEIYKPIQLPKDFEKAVSEHRGERDGELPYPKEFLSFKKGMYEVVVGFLNGRVVHIQYFPKDSDKKVVKEELFALLKANGGSREWIMSSTKMFPFSPANEGENHMENNLTLWTTDGALRATCNPESSGVIVIMSSKLLRRFKPEKSVEKKTLFEGF